MERVREIRYLLLIGSLLVMFMNLFDCINKGRSIGAFILYVGVLLLVSLALIFIQRDSVLVLILGVIGTLTMIDIPTPNYLSAGIVFLVFSIRITKYNPIYAFTVYFATVLIVVGTHVFNALSPADAINVSIAYAVIYMMDYFLYSKKKG